MMKSIECVYRVHVGAPLPRPGLYDDIVTYMLASQAFTSDPAQVQLSGRPCGCRCALPKYAAPPSLLVAGVVSVDLRAPVPR